MDGLALAALRDDATVNHRHFRQVDPEPCAIAAAVVVGSVQPCLGASRMAVDGPC